MVHAFYWYLLHSSAAHALPEGILWPNRYAWSDTIPHATGASNYSYLLRHMFIHEQDNELHLLKAVPDWWLQPGKEIRIANAPTHFGTMNLVVRGEAKGVTVVVDPPNRDKPERILLYLPEHRPLLKAPEGVEIQIRPKQKKQWDYPTVVETYKEKGPGVRSHP